VIVLDCSLEPMNIIGTGRLSLSLTAAEPRLRFAEVHPVSLHDEPVNVSAFVASTEAVPELFLGVDYEARLVVFVEGAQARQAACLAA
jgi:hypothetical protein